MPETSRQGEDMPNRFPATHADHDPVLIAAHAAGDVTDAELSTAEALLATCPDCRELSFDLRAIAAATAALPAPARTRDFTLRSQDAARLRPRGWRRLAAALGPARLELTRPLAPVLMTLGVVGLLVSGLPLFQGSAGAAPSSLQRVGAQVEPSAAPSAAAAAPAAAAGASAAPAPSTSLTNVGSADTGTKSNFGALASSSPPTDVAGEGGYATSGATSASTPPEVSVASPPAAVAPPGPDVPLAALSAVALVAGLGLFGLRRALRVSPEH